MTIINLILDVVILVGTGMLTFQLYLYVTMFRLKRQKKWTAAREARLADMIVSMRALVSLMIFVSCCCLIGKVILWM